MDNFEEVFVQRWAITPELVEKETDILMRDCKGDMDNLMDCLLTEMNKLEEGVDRCISLIEDENVTEEQYSIKIADLTMVAVMLKVVNKTMETE